MLLLLVLIIYAANLINVGYLKRIYGIASIMVPCSTVRVALSMEYVIISLWFNSADTKQQYDSLCEVISLLLCCQAVMD
jgi:hypothetical protein